MQEDHHKGALIETARAELDRAHRGALELDGAEMRRGLTLALEALQQAGRTDAAAHVQTALSDLDTGALADMEAAIERMRTGLAAEPGPSA